MWPTVLHITHYKSGSQWLHRILHYCASERLITPRVLGRHLLDEGVKPGRIYPTVYALKEEVDRVPLPPDTRRVVIVRDLRDTLVSWYFSMKISHLIDDDLVARARAELAVRSQEEGLLWGITHSEGFARCAAVQRSWLQAGVPFHRFEDLLADDTELIPRLLLEECGLPISRELVLNAVRDTRFERLSGGRPPGVEDRAHHYRKGIVGDWRNHFTGRVTEAFKDRLGDLLILAGYERNLDW
jgi:lipopolysaccharide transport system ATP-binding protein